MTSTVYCPSYQKAIEYFQFLLYPIDSKAAEETVKQWISDGELKIGPPPSIKGMRIICENGRYYYITNYC